MGKASRQRKDRTTSGKRASRVAYAARPFEGLADEPSLVALRELLPAATLPATIAYDGAEHATTFTTVLPMGWAAMHRSDGTLFVAAQFGGGSGDLSRDLAAAALAAAAAEPGGSVASTPPVTADTPRLQDLMSGPAGTVTLHEGFDYWLTPEELDEDTRASLEQANDAISPTAALPGTPDAYWCRIGERTYVRWVLPHDEEAATSALARLHAAGTDTLGQDGRLLGAFRASGLLVPVWEVDAATDPMTYDAPLTQLRGRLEESLASLETQPLTDAERRARSGLVSRQITIR